MSLLDHDDPFGLKKRRPTDDRPLPLTKAAQSFAQEAAIEDVKERNNENSNEGMTTAVERNINNNNNSQSPVKPRNINRSAKKEVVVDMKVKCKDETDDASASHDAAAQPQPANNGNNGNNMPALPALPSLTHHSTLNRAPLTIPTLAPKDIDFESMMQQLSKPAEKKDKEREKAKEKESEALAAPSSSSSSALDADSHVPVPSPPPSSSSSSSASHTAADDDADVSPDDDDDADALPSEPSSVSAAATSAPASPAIKAAKQPSALVTDFDSPLPPLPSAAARTTSSPPIRPATASAAAASSSSSASAVSPSSILSNPNPFGSRRRLGDDAPIGGARARAAAIMHEDTQQPREAWADNQVEVVKPASRPKPKRLSSLPSPRSPSSTSSNSAATTAAAAAPTSPSSSSASASDAAAKSDAPLAARIVDKNWKTRMDAYKEIESSPHDPSYAASIGKMLSDSHASCFEACLPAVNAIVLAHPQGAALVEEIMPTIIKKGLVGRSQTKTHAMTLISSLIYVGGAIPVLSYLLISGADVNSPKSSAAAVSALRDCLHIYGPKIVRIEDIMNVWPSLLSASNVAVRKEALDLGCEMYRWLREGFTAQLQNIKLKDSQMKELEALFASVSPAQPKPEKFTKADEMKGQKSSSFNDFSSSMDVASKFSQPSSSPAASPVSASSRPALAKRPSTAAPSLPAAKPALVKAKSATLKKEVKPVAAKSTQSALPTITYEEAFDTLNSRVGSESMTLLISKKWNETIQGLINICAYIQGLKDDVDSLLALLPAVFCVLTKSPSFKPSNVQVTKQIYETLLVLLQSVPATQFPASLFLATISDTYSKLSDHKFTECIFEAWLMACEIITPKVVIAELTKVVDKEIKNIKSAEVALQFIVMVIQEFGVTVLDLHSLIEQNKEWLQSTQPTMRSVSLEIFKAIYSQTGSVLKDLILSNLKPTTLSTLEAEFAKIEQQAFTSKRLVLGQQPPALDLDAIIPRVDISEKITENIMNKLVNDNWKARKDGLDDVHQILTEANHRISGKDGGLIEVMKLRIIDNNKNLAKDALILLFTIMNDMGPAILKHGSKLVPSILIALSDSKKFVKDEAAKVLNLWVSMSGLQSIIKYLPKALDGPARKEIVDMLCVKLQGGPIKGLDTEKNTQKWDLNELILPILNCLLDKSIEIRQASEKVLEYCVVSIGFDACQEALKPLKKAMILQLTPILEKYRYSSVASMREQNGGGAAPPASAPEKLSREESKEEAAPIGSQTAREVVRSRSLKRSVPAPATSRVAATDEKKTTTTVKSSMLKRASTLPRPLSSKAPAASEESAATDAPELIKKIDNVAKKNRVAKDAKRVKGAFREVSKDEVEELDQTLYTLLSDELYSLLFNKEFQKQVVGIDMLDRQLSSSYDSMLSISDLLFKYCAWRMATDANTAVLAKLLPFLTNLLRAFEERGYNLTEGEASNLYPCLVEKVFGHNTPRFRSDTRDILNQSCALYPVAKLFIFLTYGLESKNKRVQSECLELIGTWLNKHGLSICDGKKVVPSIAVFVGASDTSVRAAALNAISLIYQVVGDELWPLLGRGSTKTIVAAKQMAMIEERIKRVKAGATIDTEESSSVSVTTPRKASVSRTRLPSRSTPPKQALATTLKHVAKKEQDDEVDNQYEQHEQEQAAEEVPEPAASQVPPPSHSRLQSSPAPAYEQRSLPDCFSLEDNNTSAQNLSGDLLSTSTTLSDTSSDLVSIPTQSLPSSSPMLHASPSKTAAQGVSSSSYLSDTIIVLSESSVPVEERCDALQHMCDLIHAQGAPALRDMHDDVIQVLVKEIASSFYIHTSTGLVTVTDRWNKVAMYTLTQIVSRKDIMRELPVSSFEHLLSYLFAQLSDPRLIRSPACTDLVTGCNNCILKSLENTPRTVAFTMVINMLRKAILNVQQANMKSTADLIAKCLLKLYKLMLKEGVDALDMAALLESIHEFMTAIPPNTAQADDLCMKALLSVLHELVRVRGASLFDHTASIPSDSILLTYINQLITPHSATAASVDYSGDISKKSGNVQHTPVKSDVASNRSPKSITSTLPYSASKLRSPAQYSTESPAQELSGIFQAFRNPDPSIQSVALKQLQQFKSKHPEMSQEVEAEWAQISTVLSGILKRKLQRLEEDDKQVETSNEPMSPQKYRQQLEHLKSRASLATAPAPVTAIPQSAATPASSAPAINQATGKAMSSLEAIRQKFKTLNPAKSTTSDAAQPQASSQLLLHKHTLSDSSSAAPSVLSTPASSSVTTTPSSTGGSSSSSLLAIRARVAAMNKSIK